MKNLIIAIVSAFMMASCLGQRGAVELTDRVNTFLGTETLWDSVELGYHPTRRTWGAETFPGSALPNAMVHPCFIISA